MLTHDLNRRRSSLLALIKERGGEWTTQDAHEIYKAHGVPNRSTARGDLKALARRGALTLHEGRGRRFFTLPGVRGGA